MAASRAGSPGWPTLLDAALGLLDDVAQRTGAPVDWALGGGTVLMLHYAHRTSRDIDVFLKDAQVFSPRASMTVPRGWRVTTSKRPTS